MTCHSEPPLAGFWQRGAIGGVRNPTTDIANSYVPSLALRLTITARLKVRRSLKYTLIRSPPQADRVFMLE